MLIANDSHKVAAKGGVLELSSMKSFRKLKNSGPRADREDFSAD